MSKPRIYKSRGFWRCDQLPIALASSNYATWELCLHEVLKWRWWMAFGKRHTRTTPAQRVKAAAQVIREAEAGL